MNGLRAIFKSEGAKEVPAEEMLRRALAAIVDPVSGKPLPESGLIAGLTGREGRVAVTLSVNPQAREAYLALQGDIEAALRQVKGVTHVTVVLTAEIPAEKKDMAKRAQWNLTPVEGVKRLIAVASGKGGVGKSTTAVYLAVALARQGKRVGLLDADLQGPSLPRMLGLSGKPELREGKIVPPVRYGIQCLSLGLLIGGEAAVMRGPMVSKTLHQLMRGTHWGVPDAPLDVLLVDMPPGTGDTALNLAQQTPLAHDGGGALLVTTPQEVALDDARRAAAMFLKMRVPLLGVIENMSWLEEASGNRLYPFGQGGGQKLADELGIALLAQIPLVPALGALADRGEIREDMLGYYTKATK